MSSRNSYKKITDVGNNYVAALGSNPLLYCAVDKVTNHMLNGYNNDTNGESSKNCQLFLASYCSKNWDNICEKLSLNNNMNRPDNTDPTNMQSAAIFSLTAGQILVRNTAINKYMVTMQNSTPKYIQFDPNVPTSPMLLTWEKNGILPPKPIYDLDSKTISQLNNDQVMNKLLDNVNIAPDILLGIYNTFVSQNKLNTLNNTRLGEFYKNSTLFKNILKFQDKL